MPTKDSITKPFIYKQESDLLREKQDEEFANRIEVKQFIIEEQLHDIEMQRQQQEGQNKTEDMNHGY